MKAPREKKMPLGITPEFIDEVSGLSPDEKKARIVTIQKDMEEAQVFLKENEKIVEQRAELRKIEFVSRETIRIQRNRTKYLLQQLKDQGAI